MSDDNKPEPPKDGILRVAPPRDGPFAEPLDQCNRAYARGDFGRARALSRQVLAGAGATAEEREFAALIEKRVAWDPAALVLGLGSFLLFWLVIYLTVWR